MQEKDFWRLTLRQFSSLVSRHIIHQEREDYRAALVCSVLANVNRDEKKRRQPFTPEDFMPGKARPQKQQTTDDMLNTVKALNAAPGGGVVEG